MAKKNKFYTNEIEYKFYQVYRMFPEEMYLCLIGKGYSCADAWCIVQNILDNLWNYKKERNRINVMLEEERLMKELERDCPWSLT